MRKLRKKTAALLKDRKGNMMPLVVAVTICMLIIILGVAEYMRLVITAAGIKDAMESAVISTVNDNYNEVYHSVREGYAAGYEPDGESFSPSVDYGDIYSRMCFLLGLEEDGAGYVRINNGGEMEYRLSNLSVYIHNNALGAGGGPYYADASIRLEVPVRFTGKIITKTITANIVDLDRNPPPNPVADDRNDSYNAGNAIIPANPQKTSASWSVWRPWWKEKWVWHSDWKWKTGSHTEECEEDCESSHGYWEDEGEYVDEGWWEFSLDRYSASLSATMDLTTDAKSPTATATTIKSGYGVNISVNASASTGQSSATTPPQTAVSYFPEFYYKTYWRLLDRTRSGYHAGFEFRNNHYSTYNRRTHFTPVWMPNGTYTVYTYLLDCWTPDGMLSVNLTDSVQISGDLWDDWHIAPQRAR